MAESREERSQLQNKKRAFNKIVKSESFQRWLRFESSKKMGILSDIDQMVKEAMRSDNLKIEYYDSKENKWNTI